MGWKNIMVGSHDLHSVAKAYVKVVTDISKLFEPTPPTNIITNETIYCTMSSMKSATRLIPQLL